MIVTQSQGQYRMLASDEIGHFVASCRKRLGMKQLALALEVGVDERTIQRIERGAKVSEDTLGKVARFLGFDESAFVAPRYVPTPNEAMEKTREFCAGLVVIKAHEFATVRDSDAMLGTHGYIFNDEHVSADLADSVAELRDLLTELNDIYDDLCHAERLKACRSILSEVQKIEFNGYRARYSVYTTKDDFTVSVLMFLPKSNQRLLELKQFIVPSSFGAMATQT